MPAVHRVGRVFDGVYYEGVTEDDDVAARMGRTPTVERFEFHGGEQAPGVYNPEPLLHAVLVAVGLL